MIRSSLAVVIGALTLMSIFHGVASRGQGVLVGCRLGATLQCVPGLNLTPQQQIRVLKGEISDQQAQENFVVQTIEGLRRFELSGAATVGATLNADLDFDPDDFAAVQIHWYRRDPNASTWQLVGAVDQRNYRVSASDLGATLIAVVAMQPNGGAVMRHHSNSIGPITN